MEATFFNFFWKIVSVPKFVNLKFWIISSVIVNISHKLWLVKNGKNTASLRGIQHEARRKIARDVPP